MLTWVEESGEVLTILSVEHKIEVSGASDGKSKHHKKKKKKKG